MISFFKLLVVCTITFIIIGLFFYFSELEHIELKTNSIKTLHFTEQIRQKILLKLNSYKGKNIWSVKLKDLAFEVKKIYPAAQIQVTRQLPHRMTVFLKYKDVAVLLLRDTGSLHSISFQGDIQESLPLDQSLDLPILRGERFWTNKSLRKKAIFLLSRLPETGLFVSKNISEIIYKKDRLSFLFILISHHLTLEVKTELSSKKIENINLVLNYLIQKNIQKGQVKALFEKKIIVNVHN